MKLISKVCAVLGKSSKKHQMLPNLCRLSLHSPSSPSSLSAPRCAPCGVTKERFSVLLPGMTLAPGQREPDVAEEDKTCAICQVYLRWPAEGFKESDNTDDSAVYTAQEEYDALTSEEAKAAKREAYFALADAAAERIRTATPARTKLELLLPGCGHQFHKECLRKWVNGPMSQSDKCPICKTPIDPSIKIDLRNTAPASQPAQPANPPAQNLTAPFGSDSDSDDDDDDDYALPDDGAIDEEDNPYRVPNSLLNHYRQNLVLNNYLSFDNAGNNAVNILNGLIGRRYNMVPRDPNAGSLLENFSAFIRWYNAIEQAGWRVHCLSTVSAMIEVAPSWENVFLTWYNTATNSMRAVYSPTSPSYSPTSPNYSPTSPNYDPDEDPPAQRQRINAAAPQ